MNSAYEQINRARKDFPKLKIAVFNQPRHNGIFFVAKCMNDVVMFALRRAIKEKRLSPNADIIAIRNDSDILHMHKEYLASYLEAAEQNPSTPVFYAHSWPSISQSYLSPGFAASVFLDRELNYLHNQKGDIFTAGGNFGYRVQHFAAVNGFGYNCEHLWKKVGSDDIQIGYRIRLGFFEKALRENFLIGVFVPNAIVDTDCTRYLYTYMDDNQALVAHSYEI